MSGLARLATIACSTKRKQYADGKYATTGTAYLTGLTCTPVDPVDAETKMNMDVDVATRVYQTFLEGDLDIKQGDILVVGSEEYEVRWVEKWIWKRTTLFTELLLDKDVK